MKDFENCLGKHTDSLEYGLVILSEQMRARQAKEKTIIEHDTDVDTLPGSRPVFDAENRGDQFLLSSTLNATTDEPVYDVPKKPVIKT